MNTFAFKVFFPFFPQLPFLKQHMKGMMLVDILALCKVPLAVATHFVLLMGNVQRLKSRLAGTFNGGRLHFLNCDQCTTVCDADLQASGCLTESSTTCPLHGCLAGPAAGCAGTVTTQGPYKHLQAKSCVLC